MSDHVHILIGLKPAMALANLVRDIKADSSDFVNRRKWVRGRFNWQEGYGAFSYGHSQLGTVIRYIQNQEQHHQRRTFKDEYLTWLKKFEFSLMIGTSLSSWSEHCAPNGARRVLWTTQCYKHCAPNGAKHFTRCRRDNV